MGVVSVFHSARQFGVGRFHWHHRWTLLLLSGRRVSEFARRLSHFENSEFFVSRPFLIYIRRRGTLKLMSFFFNFNFNERQEQIEGAPIAYSVCFLENNFQKTLRLHHETYL